MFIYCNKQKMWVNLNQVQRIGMDGTGNYILVSTDGVKTSISKEEYEEALKYLEPAWYEKHPPKDFDYEGAFKAIMDATGAKIKKEED